MVEKLTVKHPEFKRRLRTMAKVAGIGVADIKTRLGVTYEMARRYWLGYAKPRGKKMEMLAKLALTTPAYLEYGDEEHGAPLLTEQDRPPYEAAALSHEAVDVAKAWSRLSKEKQLMYRIAIFRDAAAEKVCPWLIVGRPDKESYDQFEARVQAGYDHHLKQLELPL